MKIFLDADILFSAAKSDGAVRQLIEMLRVGKHVLCADAYVTEEARRNLEAKSPDRLVALTTLLKGVELAPWQADPGLDEESLKALPEKDRPVLAAAIRLRCAVLVTGDRTHFGVFYGRTPGGVAIHSPRSLVELLFSETRFGP